MGKCTLRFDRIEIINQKSDTEHSDNDWISMVWTINDKVYPQTLPLKTLNGSQVLHSGDVLSGFEDYVICEDTDLVTVTYMVTNLSSYDWGKQAEAASRLTQHILNVIAPIYLKAGSILLGMAGSLGAPVIAQIIAGATAELIDKYGDKIGELIDLAFNEAITPALGLIADEVVYLLGGQPNCNGEVFHDYVIFQPREPLGDVLISKEYAGSQNNHHCGNAPRTKVNIKMLRERDHMEGQFGVVQPVGSEEMAMSEFRHRAEAATREGRIGAYPNFYYASHGRNNSGGTIFLKNGLAEWRDVPLHELGDPPLEDFGARMRATAGYAQSKGFLGGFPTFFHAERYLLSPFPVGLGLNTAAFGGRVVPDSGLQLAKVCGTVLIKPAAGEWRDVPLAELGNPSLSDIGARFRATHDYAVRHGFVGGFPNFHHMDYGSGIVCGTVLLKPEAAEWQEVLLWIGPA